MTTLLSCFLTNLWTTLDTRVRNFEHDVYSQTCTSLRITEAVLTSVNIDLYSVYIMLAAYLSYNIYLGGSSLCWRLLSTCLLSTYYHYLELMVTLA